MNLPRPEITVGGGPVTDDGGIVTHHHCDVVISRDGKARSYSSDGPTGGEAFKGALRKIIDDPITGEWLP